MNQTIYNKNSTITVTIPTGICAAQLPETDLPEPEWLIPEWIPAGLCVLGAGPKSGKTIFGMQLACAVSTGIPFLEKDVSTGRVLYLDLESSVRRSRDRLQKMGMHLDELTNLIIVNEGISSIGEGFEDQIIAYKMQYPDLRLVVVDTWQKVAPPSKGYQKDCTVFHNLRELATSLNITILLLHHLNKAKHKDDPSQRLYGTNAMYANVDTLMLLTTDDRSSDQFIFSITGNDIEPVQERLELALMHWTVIDDSDGNSALIQQVQQSAYYQALLYAFEVYGNHNSVRFTPKQLREMAIEKGIGDIGDPKTIAKWIRENVQTLIKVMNAFISEGRTKNGVEFTFLLREDNLQIQDKTEAG